MKKTILLFGLVAGISAAGQNKDVQDIQKLIRDKQAKDKIENEKFKSSFPRRYIQQNLPSTIVYRLPNGDKVVYGTIDGMPIVVPDMRNFNFMPNVRVDMNQFRTMPNGAVRIPFNDLGVAGSNKIMDELAPSQVLENLLKKKGN